MLTYGGDEFRLSPLAFRQITQRQPTSTRRMWRSSWVSTGCEPAPTRSRLILKSTGGRQEGGVPYVHGVVGLEQSDVQVDQVLDAVNTVVGNDAEKLCCGENM